MDTVLIPAWRRPEFLWHCIENIKRARGADQQHYIFRFDYDHAPELHEVVKGFPFSHEIAVTPRNKYRAGKQSYSVLTGYAMAAEKAEPGGLVFMIEEDVMIATDFFEFHRAAHQQELKLFCSIAVANPNRTIEGEGGHDEYYLSYGDYCSLGVCYRSETIKEVIGPWMQTNYFIDPTYFCAKHFPTSPIGKGFAEQDGLIRRIQWRGTDPIAWPWKAKAYHAGLYGANRGNGPSGNWISRLKYITDIIYSDEAMRTFARHPSFYEDSKPINLNAEPWKGLKYKALEEKVPS